MSEIEDAFVAELPRPWETIQDGDYAIVELFGHTTLVGRIEEVERFGTKMLAIQPIFAGKLLGPIYNGGAAIYRLTPCSREVAWTKQHREEWQLPATIRAVIPQDQLPLPMSLSEAPPSGPANFRMARADDEDDEAEADDSDDYRGDDDPLF
jgi:hypothetical protein